ncbi:MAG TPA: PHP domain-containing protein, partial [Candidatus Paceibacterota bacterium]
MAKCGAQRASRRRDRPILVPGSVWRAELALKLGDIRLAVDDLVVGNPARNADYPDGPGASDNEQRAWGMDFHKGLGLEFFLYNSRMSKFVHLHTHSHYSLLQALPKVPELVAKAKADGAEALALTDAGNMYGTIEFYKECRAQKIKPIIGVDFYVAARTRKDREPRIDNRRTRLVLLAKNIDGYKNLLKLVTYSHLEGFYYRPRIDKELIEKYHEGLVAISPSFSGEIAQAIRNGNEELAKEWTKFYKNIFGEDFYLEITAHPEMENHGALMERLAGFARTEKAEIV